MFFFCYHFCIGDKKEINCVLLCLLSKPSIDKDSDDLTEEEKQLQEKDSEATNFCAEVCTNYIRNVIEKDYGVDVAIWVLCQTADNCSVNKSTAKWPHVPYANHLLNSQVCAIINKLKEKNDRISIGKFVLVFAFQLLFV